MIHKYQMNNYNIVLDTNSGGVHVVDDLMYELLDYVNAPLAQELSTETVAALSPRYSFEDVNEAYSELLELEKSGVLFSTDEYEKFADMMVSAPIKSMCLHVAHDCNLRCPYCFAETGDFGGGRMLMDATAGKKAIDFLLEHSQGRRNLELDFFGGEPLMNMDVVKAVVRYARSKEAEYNKNFRFTITTNGVLLDDETIDYLNKEMHNIVLSIDGRRNIHDRMRPAPNGKGSYDLVLPHFQKFVKKRGEGQYYVRGTFTKYNLDFANDVFALNEAGFDQISVEPVVTNARMPYAITDDDLPVVFSEYERLAKMLLDKKRKGEGFNFFHFMLDLDQGPCAIKRLRGCGCGNEYVAVAPNGDIYPCHQFVGMQDWKMGSVFDGTINKDMKNLFARTNVYNKEECKNCWAKFYCSGGCNANNLQYAGALTKPFKTACEMEKKRLECAVMIKAAMSEES